MPPQNLLIHTLNSSHVTLNLGSWLDGGCPITSFDIKYKFWGQQAWTTVNSNINPDEVCAKHVIQFSPNFPMLFWPMKTFSPAEFVRGVAAPVHVVRDARNGSERGWRHRRAPQVLHPRLRRK